MAFLQLVRREMQGSLRRLIFVSLIGGVSGYAILASIVAGGQAADKGTSNVWSAALFVVALLLFVQTQHYILITTTAEIQAIIHKLRIRLMDYVRRSELLPLETIGRAEIVAAITRETATLTQAANAFPFAVQAALLILLVAAYVAYKSLIAFFLGALIVGVGATLFYAKNRQLTIEMQEAHKQENHLYDRLTDLLDGFKEVRLNTARSDDLFDDIVEVSRAAANIKKFARKARRSNDWWRCKARCTPCSEPPRSSSPCSAPPRSPAPSARPSRRSSLSSPHAPASFSQFPS